jgi:hypothetical protein
MQRARGRVVDPGSRRLLEAGCHTVEADEHAEKVWTDRVMEAGSQTLAATARPWFFGDNVEGKAHAYLGYQGALYDFVDRLDPIRENDYEGFKLS